MRKNRKAFVRFAKEVNLQEGDKITYLNGFIDSNTNEYKEVEVEDIVREVNNGIAKVNYATHFGGEKTFDEEIGCYCLHSLMYLVEVNGQKVSPPW